MPQTVEAINHAKAAKVPMIVAINKIDKTDSKPERVRTELLQYEVQVEVLGFTGTPDAGDRLAVVDSEARAREVTGYRARQKRDKAAARQTGMRGSLEQMMAQVKTAGRKEFPLVIKGDVQGSVEAIAGALDKIGNDEVGARIIHSGVGGITESDITLAESSGAAIIGFNVRAHKEAAAAAEGA